MLRVKKDKLQELEKFGFVHIDDNDFCMSIIIREKICVAVKKEGYIAKIEVEYKELEKLKYFCKKKEISIINVDYLENVIVELEFKKEEKEIFENKEKLNFDYLNYKIIQEKFI